MALTSVPVIQTPSALTPHTSSQQPSIPTNMPLFGKAKPKEKPKEEVVKVNRTPTVEDKYDMKDVLGT